MRFWAIALGGLAMIAAADLALAQSGSIGAPSRHPAAGSVGSSSPAPAPARPSRPSTSPARPPVRGADGMLAVRMAGPRGPQRARPLWFGLVTFDRSWFWTPTVVDMTVDAPLSATT